MARSAAPLADDAGSAFRAFHSLIDDPRTEALDPMMITGRTVLVDAGHGDELVSALNAQLVDDGLEARCRYEPTDDPRVLEIAGEGPAWSSATYVRLLTDVFESGATRCLVGTRGLFGEGWDALALNTLVDLTSVTTSTSVQQLRGRSIRLDPSWPRKVSHNWDVLCVATDHPRGDVDLRRFVRRHGQLWGVVPPNPGRELLSQAVGVAAAGQGSTIDAWSVVRAWCCWRRSRWRATGSWRACPCWLWPCRSRSPPPGWSSCATVPRSGSCGGCSSSRNRRTPSCGTSVGRSSKHSRRRSSSRPTSISV